MKSYQKDSKALSNPAWSRIWATEFPCWEIKLKLTFSSNEERSKTWETIGLSIAKGEGEFMVATTLLAYESQHQSLCRSIMTAIQLVSQSNHHPPIPICYHHTYSKKTITSKNNNIYICFQLMICGFFHLHQPVVELICYTHILSSYFQFFLSKLHTVNWFYTN